MNNSLFTVLILSGGLATRLKPLSDTIPKPLVEINGKPFIFHQLEQLQKQGIKHVHLCLGHMGEQIQALVKDGSQWGLRVTYSFDGSRLLGTGGAIKKAIPQLGDAFFVLYGDSYLFCDYAVIQKAYLDQRKRALMTIYQNTGRWDKSNVAYEQGVLKAYSKTQVTEDMKHIDYGLGVLSAAVFDAVPADVSVDLAGIYEQLLKDNELAAFEVFERFYEIGSHTGIDEFRSFLTNQSEYSHELY